MPGSLELHCTICVHVFGRGDDPELCSVYIQEDYHVRMPSIQAIRGLYSQI